MKNTSQSQITEYDSSKFVLKMFLNLENVPHDLGSRDPLFFPYLLISAHCRGSCSATSLVSFITQKHTSVAVIFLLTVHCFLFSDLPAYGSVRRALPLSYTLFNKTSTVQEVEAKIEQNDHFMFTGSKEVS